MTRGDISVGDLWRAEAEGFALCPNPLRDVEPPLAATLLWRIGALQYLLNIYIERGRGGNHYEVEITRSSRSSSAGHDRKGVEVHHARCCAVRIDTYIRGG